MNDQIDHITRKITEKKHTLICISPHLDDAILSAGGLLNELKNTNKIVNITIFTQPADISPSLSVKAFLKQCQYPTAQALYADRKIEDKEVFARLNADSYHLDHIDALWRPLEHPNLIQKLAGKILPEFLYTYPIYRLHVISGQVSKHDKNLIQKATQKIKEICNKYPNPLILCPVGIGKNVDHILTRDLCTAEFPNTIYWTDFPYSLNHSVDSNFIKKHKLISIKNTKGIKEKEELIKGYKTQVDALFPDKTIPQKPETFYLAEEILEK